MKTPFTWKSPTNENSQGEIEGPLGVKIVVTVGAGDLLLLDTVLNRMVRILNESWTDQTDLEVRGILESRMKLREIG